MNGLKLATIYSWNCQTAKKLKVSKKLFDFASGETDDNRGIKKILMALSPYKSYSAIAKTKRSPNKFSLEVVSFYWRSCHNRAVLSLLYHLPLAKINLKHINECFIVCGKIKSVGKNHFIVECRSIIQKKNILALGKLIRKKVANPLKLEAKINDIVSSHYSDAAEVLSQIEAKRLTKTTKKILREFNAKRK